MNNNIPPERQIPLLYKIHHMKQLILTSVTILFISTATFSQNLRYELHGAYQRAVKKGALEKAKFISDIIPDYPESWIMEYDSVDIEVTSGGKTMKARGKNNILSQEQKEALNQIDLAAYIAINVHYKYNNVLDSHIEKNKLNITFRVVPEVEAEFVGGKEKLDNYIKEKGIDKIAGKIPKQFSEVIVSFTVNETGEITDASVFKTSGSDKVDKLLLDAIKAMPKWKPAENGNGKKVKQEFEFSVNSGMGGC